MPPSYDVAIVGGGVAGLSAGIGLARRGLSTIVFEKKTWPIDKACGEGLMPHGVRELARLGVLAHLSCEDSRSFLGIEVISHKGRRARATFADGYGLGVRRLALSAALHKVAMGESKLTLCADTRVLGVEERAESIAVHTLRDSVEAKVVIGADGLRSTMRTRGTQQPLRVRRYGANQHFKVPPWNTHVEVYLSNGIEAYVTPCGDNQVGVAFLWHYAQYTPQEGRGALVDQCLERFPDLREKLMHAQTIGPLQATGPMFRAVTESRLGRLVLIGDAAGYYDAITGEGMSLALLQARLISQMPWPYHSWKSFERKQKRMQRINRVVTRFTLAVASRPWLQNFVFSLLARESRVFRFFLSFANSP